MPPVVVVRPLSGYVNRLQAIVSGSLLAESLGSSFLVCWEESDVAPVAAADVLGPAWCAAHVRTRQMIRDDFGVDPATVEPYLKVTGAGDVITLAGLDLGEQHFMPELRSLLAITTARVVVLSAGGKFTLAGDAVLTDAQAKDFRNRRCEAYGELPLHPEIERRAAFASAHRPFVGLHLRYSDRSAQTPWPRTILPAVQAVVEESGTGSVFVASDSGQQRSRWIERLASSGLDPWAAEPGDFPRSDPRSVLGAMVDWRILTRAQALVYFAASSFGEEAAVASGSFSDSIALAASGMRTAWVRAGQYAEAARTYPRRHGWWDAP